MMKKMMKKILIIDDDDLFRDMMKKLLERAGYQVFEAMNGYDGLKMAEKMNADLIVTDIIMPEKEGIETIIELRKDHPETKIIAVSGGGRLTPEFHLSLAQKMGVQKSFAKPFDNKQFLAAVKELV